MIYVPKAALILSRGNSTLGKLIRWGQRTWGEAPSRVNHSILCTGDGWWPAQYSLREPQIVESDKVVRTGPLSKYHAGDALVIYDIEMTEEERALVVADALRHQGRPYAVLQLVGQLVDNKLFFGRNVLRRLFRHDPLDICSRLTGDALARVGVKLGVPGYAQSPDDQDDALRAALEGTGLVCGRRVRCLLDELGPREKEREV